MVLVFTLYTVFVYNQKKTNQKNMKHHKCSTVHMKQFACATNLFI